MKDKNSKRSKIFSLTFSFCILIFSFYVSAQAVNAATLYFSPASGSYASGNSFSVGVYVSSPDRAMNAASGRISFPNDKLELLSLSKAGSIFSLWVQEPEFNQAIGTARFEGIVLNPGFSGEAGKILALNFRVKAGGVANLKFDSGSVLANDGQGTNILTDLGVAQFSLGTAVAPPSSVTAAEIAGLPQAPEITSPTHPDSNRWYANKNAKFEWKVPAGISGMRLLVGSIPQAIPNVTYTPPVNSKEISELPDGIWYFHARFRNENGWGDISHYRFQIDTAAPENLSVKALETESDNPRPKLEISANDSLSGIDHFEIKIGDTEPFNILPEDVKDGIYEMPLQTPGKKTILLKAFDRAGNYSTASADIYVKPIDAPQIISYPKEITEGEAVIIIGKTYPGAAARILIKKEDGGEASGEALADSAGEFTLVWKDKLGRGIYKFRAVAIDKRGAQSNPTGEFVFSVKEKEWIRWGTAFINYLSLIIAVLAIIGALAFSSWHIWQKFLRLRGKIRREAAEAKHSIHRAFDLLRDDVQKEIRILEKVRSRRELTTEEEKIISQLKRTLDQSEKILREEIEKIEKEVK